MAVFILQQDNGSILSKTQEWVMDLAPQAVFETPYRDVALNQLLELNLKDSRLRARVIECHRNERGLPILPAVEHPQFEFGREELGTGTAADTTPIS